MEEIFSYDRSNTVDYYAILGCTEHSSVEQIATEYRARVVEAHPDKNPDDAEAAKNRFQLLQRAKDVLTDPEQRVLFDQWRRSGLAIPFEQWRMLGAGRVRTMHWATRTKTDPMIEPAVANATSEQTSRRPASAARAEAASWASATKPESEVLRKFRNYEI